MLSHRKARRSQGKPGQIQEMSGGQRSLRWWELRATRLPCGAGVGLTNQSSGTLPCTSSGLHLFPHTQISPGAETMAVSSSWLSATDSQTKLPTPSPLAPFRVLYVMTEFPLKQFILSSVTLIFPANICISRRERVQTELICNWPMEGAHLVFFWGWTFPGSDRTPL